MASIEGAAESQTKGTIDGRTCTFVYQRAIANGGDQEEGCLRWSGTEKGGEQTHAGLQEVSVRNIIAFAPITSPDAATAVTTAESAGRSYRLIYIENDSLAAEDKTRVPIVLRHADVTNPPALAVHDFRLHGPDEGNSWAATETTTAVDGKSDNARFPHRHIIVSRGSGTGLAEEFWRTVAQPLLSLLGLRDSDYQLHLTSDAESITTLTRDVLLPAARRGSTQDLALLSGDGGLLDILNALILSDGGGGGGSAATALEDGGKYQAPRVALLPLGTGNAAAHSAGLTSHDDTLGMRTWLRGGAVAKPLPYFRATFSPGAVFLVDEGRGTAPLPSILTTDGSGSGSGSATAVPTAYGAVVASWGLHASLVADSDTAAYRKFGSERFSMAAKEALFPADGGPPHVYRGKVSVLRRSGGAASGDDGKAKEEQWEPLNCGPTDDNNDKDTHGYILATFMHQLERGFTISPAARPLDGALRLVHFGALSGNAAMEVMQGAFAGGTHVDDARVGYEEIAGLRIVFAEEDEDPRWRRVCVDGKIVAVERGGWAEVRVAQSQGSVLDLAVPL